MLHTRHPMSSNRGTTNADACGTYGDTEYSGDWQYSTAVDGQAHHGHDAAQQLELGPCEAQKPARASAGAPHLRVDGCKCTHTGESWVVILPAASPLSSGLVDVLLWGCMDQRQEKA